MLTVLGIVVATVMVVALLVVALAWPNGRPMREPSPRPKKDDRVAVLEGGSGRSWD